MNRTIRSYLPHTQEQHVPLEKDPNPVMLIQARVPAELLERLRILKIKNRWSYSEMIRSSLICLIEQEQEREEAQIRLQPIRIGQMSLNIGKRA